MQSKTIKYTILLILASLLLATGCNADASAGLFRQISESSAPIGIVYRQLLGFNTAKDTLFYRTVDGIYSTDLSTKSTLVQSSEGNLIQAAYYNATKQKVLYLSNADADKIKWKDTATQGEFSPTSTSISSNSSLRNLYANGLVMMKGLDASSNKVFSLLQYDELSDSIPAAPKVDFTGINDYSLGSVLQMTGRETEAVSPATPIIVSFVNTDSSYIHYYFDGTTKTELSSATFGSIRFAGFSLIDGTLYILSTNGELFGGTVGGTFTKMYDASKTYDEYAFMYAVTDGSNTHIITKPSSASASLYIFSFAKNDTSSTNVSTASIRYGYGEYLDSADIVSAYVISPNIATANSAISSITHTLLVATNTNGMYKIEIESGTASSNDTTNGTTSESEAYTF
ncbi:MAG: hypothetical protein AB7C91_00825 [Sphaerochaeta sp.]